MLLVTGHFYLSLVILYWYMAVSNGLHTARLCLLGYWLVATYPRGICIISQGGYLRAGRTLGINTPSQCGISNSFPIHRWLNRVYIYFSESFILRRR
jgi:hypothetical protein